MSLTKLTLHLSNFRYYDQYTSRIGSPRGEYPDAFQGLIEQLYGVAGTLETLNVLTHINPNDTDYEMSEFIRSPSPVQSWIHFCKLGILMSRALQSFQQRHL